jgi:hypothetical protein
MATGGRGGKLWEKENKIENLRNIPNININNYNYLFRNNINPVNTLKISPFSLRYAECSKNHDPKI